MNGHALKELAQAWATVAHDGISRKGAGEPYINHPARMVESQYIWGWRQQALCWLHDVVEDSDDPEAMIKAIRLLFGDDLARDLLLLSRLPVFGWLVRASVDLKVGIPLTERGEKEPYQSWIERIALSERQDVIAVKLADLEDNMRDLKDIPGAQSKETRYLRAKATLLEVYREG